LDAFVVLNCSKLIVMHGIESMNTIYIHIYIYIYIYIYIGIIALANARKFGLLILKLLTEVHHRIGHKCP